MRNAYLFHRYRKYRRKAFKKSDPLATMKWRYWFRLFGEHKNLWEQDE